MPRQKRQHLKQRADGRFCCRYHGIQFMGQTEAEALAARELYKQREQTGHPVATMTVGEYASRWLPVHKATVSVKCYNDYAKQIDTMLSVIGAKLLTDVTADDAASIWLKYAGYSASTIKRARMLYLAIFDSAIESEYCRKNPFRAKSAQPPKAPAGTHRILTDEEIYYISSTPHRFRLPVLIMLYCGLRRGEVLALKSEDIDTETRTLSVTKAVRFDGNRATITVPKTAAGVRTVPVLDILLPYLRGVSGLIAPSASGETMTSSAFKRAWASYLHALSTAAGHPVSFRPHDLRHTYCTMLRDADVDIHQAMLWLGHSDEKMILRIYDHITATRTEKSVKIANNYAFRMQNDMQEFPHPPQTLIE